MITYPLGDLLIRIKNGFLTRKESVSLPWSGVKERAAQLMVEKGVLSDCQVTKTKKVAEKELVLKLKYDENHQPVIKDVFLFSKPGRRFYAGFKKLPYPREGRGLIIVSTPEGIISAREARGKKIGGEVIGEIVFA